MSKITYNDFIREQTHTIKKGLEFFDINEKKGKSYNNFLIQFLQGSSLTVTNQCNFDDKKKNEVLIDILLDIPVIDPALFDNLIKRREKYIITKPLGGSNIDYEIRTENIKEKIKKPIKDFVQDRTKKYFDLYSNICDNKIELVLGNFKKIDKEIEEYEMNISHSESGNDEYEKLLSGEEIKELKTLLGELKEERDCVYSDYIDYREEYEFRKNTYPGKIKLFEKKLQTLAEKYIFAHTNPLIRLKKSYIELFLLDKIDIGFLQGSEYRFSLGEKTLSLIEDKKKSLLNTMQIQKKLFQQELNFDQ